jgi:hypothetical protein
MIANIRRFLGLLLTVVVFLSVARAAEPTAFVVTVSPDTFAAGASVDVEVRAVDAGGKVVTDYDGDVFLAIDETSTINQDKYTLPSDGFYEFVAKDQGIKTFSKGLIVNQAGTYTFVAEDIYDSSIRGQATIIITDGNGNLTVGDAVVRITSPVDGTTVSQTTINILGTSDSPRTPVFVELNGSLVDTQTSTNQAGDFSVYVADLQEGSNTLRIQLKDVNDAVLGQTETIDITLEIDDSVLLESFALKPAAGAMAGDKIQIAARVWPRVSSARLLIDNQPQPLNRIESYIYTNTIVFQDEGEYDLAMELQVDGDRITEDVEDITIAPAPLNGTGKDYKTYGIGLIDYQIDPLDPGTVTLSREPEGDVSEHYAVYHGINPDALDTTTIVNGTSTVLEWLSLEETTFVQVWPSDGEGNPLGNPSDPLAISFQAAAPHCIVKGIVLRTEQLGDKYYLTWDTVAGAQEYIIYRADFAVQDITKMQEVGRTSGTTYEYPFDPTADSEEYAYYAVEAVCEGDTRAVLENIQKVQVWPVSSALVVLLIVSLLYFLYRVNVYKE